LENPLGLRNNDLNDHSNHVFNRKPLTHLHRGHSIIVLITKDYYRIGTGKCVYV